MKTAEGNTRAAYETLMLIGGDRLVNLVGMIYDVVDRAERQGFSDGYDVGLALIADAYDDGYQQAKFEADNPDRIVTDECQCPQCQEQDEQDAAEKAAGFDQGLQDYINSQSDEPLFDAGIPTEGC